MPCLSGQVASPFFGGDFSGLFGCFVFVALPVASLPGGHDLAAYCINLASGSWCFFFPSLVFPCCSKYFSGYLLPLMFIYIMSFFSFALFFLFSSLSFVFSFFQCI